MPKTAVPTDLPMPMAGEVNRKNGRYAICAFVGGTGVGTLVLDAFDWEVEIVTDFVDGTAHGDLWDVPVPLKYSWTGRVRGYWETLQNTYLHAFTLQAGSPVPDILTGTFTAYGDDTSTVIVFQGACYAVRTRWNVPNAMLEQELELRGFGKATQIS